MTRPKTEFRKAGTWLLVAASFGVAACRAKLDARVKSGEELPSADSTDEIVREFVVEPLVGLNVDASHSGLGFDLALPQDVVSSRETFRLVVTLRPDNGPESLALTLDSDEIESLERPTTLEFPRSMFPVDISEESSGLLVKDRSGISRILDAGALTWSDATVAVSTSQSMGEWSFIPIARVIEKASYLVVTTSGLTISESLKYEIKLLNQRLLDQTFEVRLPDQVIYQKITGDEIRSVSAPAGAVGSFAIAILEGPLQKTCEVSSISGSTSGRVPISITCAER